MSWDYNLKSKKLLIKLCGLLLFLLVFKKEFLKG